MKKIMAFAGAAAMALSMAGCGGGKDMSGSEFVGEWTATNYEMWEIEMSAEEMGETIVNLKADGKADLTLMEEEIKNANWDETEDGGITIKKGGVEIEGYMENGGLTLTYSDIYIYLQK